MSKKTIFLSMALLGCVFSQASAEAICDTIVFEQVDRVKIETRDTVQRIVVSGTKDNPQLHYVQRISIPDTSAVRRTLKSVKDFNKITITKKKETNSQWDASFHLFLGLNTMLNSPNIYGFKVWPSFDCGLAALWDYRPYGKKNTWSAGFSLDWKRYKMNYDSYLGPLYSSASATDNRPSNYGQSKHRRYYLSVVSLQIPFMFTHYFDADAKWGVTLGGILNWNVGATTERDYTIGDEDLSTTTRNIGERPITIDGLFIVHLPSFPDIYCKYSPTKFFKTGRGPEMNQLSIGLYW